MSILYNSWSKVWTQILFESSVIWFWNFDLSLNCIIEGLLSPKKCPNHYLYYYYTIQCALRKKHVPQQTSYFIEKWCYWNVNVKCFSNYQQNEMLRAAGLFFRFSDKSPTTQRVSKEVPGSKQQLSIFFKCTLILLNVDSTLSQI